MLLTIHLIQFQKMPDEKRKGSETNKFLTLTEQTNDITSLNYSLNLKRSALMFQFYFDFDYLSYKLINDCQVTTNRFKKLYFVPFRH